MKSQITLTTIILSLLMLVLVGCGDSGNNVDNSQKNNAKYLVNVKWKFTAYIDEVNNTKEEPEDPSFRTDEAGLIIEFTENKISKQYIPSTEPNKEMKEIKGYGYWDKYLSFVGYYDLDKNRDNGIKLSIEQLNKIMEPKDAEKFYDIVNKTHSFDATKDNLKLYYGEEKEKYLLFNKLTQR